MRRWLFLAALVVGLDQLSKWAVSSTLAYLEGIPVLPFFSLVRVHNTGAAFSFLADAAGWQRWFFIAIGALATVIIVRLLRRHSDEPSLASGLSLVLGGALGNVIDRLIHGHVVDFLYFHYQGFAFPAFNLADSAITVGAVLLIVDNLRRPARP
jgi:signal peptidase II